MSERRLWAAAIASPAVILAGVSLGAPAPYMSTPATLVLWSCVSLCLLAAAIVTSGRLEVRLPPERTALVLLSTALLGLLSVNALAPRFGNHAVALGHLLVAPATVLALGQRNGPLTERRAGQLLWGLLGVALIVRGLQILTWPRPLMTLDAPGWTQAAHAVLEGQGFADDPSRTPAFAAFYLLNLSWGGLLGQRLAQAAVGLLTAWLLARALQPTTRRGALVGFALVALHPFALQLEASLMAETLFGLVLLCFALALLRGLREGGDPGWLALAGALGAAAVLTKPVAVAPLAAGGLCALVVLGRRAALAGSYALAAGAPLLLWALRNQATHGFFGLTLFGGLTLLGVSGRLIDLDSPRHAETKALIRPAVETYRAMDDPDHINWIMYDPEGVGPRLGHMPRIERDALFRDLAWEGIARAPHSFLYDALYRARLYLRPHHAAFVAYPLAEAAPEQGRLWQELAERYPRALYSLSSNGLLRSLEDASARSYAARRSEQSFRLLNLILYPLLMVLHLLALPVALLYRDQTEVWIPLTLAWSVLVLTVLLNVALPRYLVPVIPLLALGLGNAYPRLRRSARP